MNRRRWAVPDAPGRCGPGGCYRASQKGLGGGSSEQFAAAETSQKAGRAETGKGQNPQRRWRRKEAVEWGGARKGEEREETSAREEMKRKARLTREARHPEQQIMTPGAALQKVAATTEEAARLGAVVEMEGLPVV